MRGEPRQGGHGGALGNPGDRSGKNTPGTPRWISLTAGPLWGGALALLFLLPAGAGAAPPARIVSLAPSVTEFLFALGAGDRVVGVTRYCAFPPEAGALPKVGGYLDPNYEAIVSLRPDLVILMKTHEEARARLVSLGIRALAVDHDSVSGILESVPAIAAAIGTPGAGKALAEELSARVERVRRKAAGGARPRVMMVVGRNLASEVLSDVYISGRDGYYDQLLSLAGGENAYRDSTLAFPAVSAEGMLRLDPDFVFEVIPGIAGKPGELARARSRWTGFAGLRAGREGRAFVFGEGYAVVPGPRFVLLLEEMARALHPGVRWDE